MQLQAVVDRIEEGAAVLLVQPDEALEIAWPLTALPESVREGDFLNISVEIDAKQTDATKAGVQSMIEKLKNKHK